MPFQILSLSGGGYLGLYTALVLAEFESRVGRPLASCFDLLAGTSVGGIIALGLAAERPASEIVDSFEEIGTSVFSERPAPATWIGKIRDGARSFFTPTYSGSALRDTLEQLFGADTLVGELRHPVIVPTVNVTSGRPQIFKTPHHPDFQRDHLLKVVDVAMATSAAPTYFPLVEVRDHLFADGGLYANSPDLLALHEVEHFLKVPSSEVRLLSVGTTTSLFSFPHVDGTKLGLKQWAGRLARVMIAAQQASVNDIVGHRLQDRYLRVDSVQAPELMP